MRLDPEALDNQAIEVCGVCLYFVGVLYHCYIIEDDIIRLNLLQVIYIIRW